MRKLSSLIALPILAIALFYGCTKEREPSGPDSDMTCLGCHSDQSTLQNILADAKWIPAPSGREDG